MSEPHGRRAFVVAGVIGGALLAAAAGVALLAWPSGDPVLRLPSPDGTMILTATVNRNRADATKYLCVKLEIRDAGGKLLYQEQTGASHRMRWDVRWLDNRRIRLDSSDIGPLDWARQADGSWRPLQPGAEHGGEGKRGTGMKDWSDPCFADEIGLRLHRSVEELYRVFAAYPLDQQISMCAWCQTEEDDRLIRSRPLRELTWLELRSFAENAVIDWGEAKDLKHFLPRICELMVLDLGGEKAPSDPEMIYNKLRYAYFDEWTEPERHAVLEHLEALWAFLLCRSPLDPEIGDWLCGIGFVVDDLRPLLAAWTADGSAPARRHLADFVVKNAGGFAAKHRLWSSFWGDRPVQAQQVLDWLAAEETASLLERLRLQEDGPELHGKLEEALKAQNNAFAESWPLRAAFDGKMGSSWLSGRYEIMLLDGVLPPTYETYKKNTRLSAEYDLSSAQGRPALFCVKRNWEGDSERNSLLVVALRYRYLGAGFYPDALVVPETGLCLIGAGDRLLAFDLKGPAKLWEDATQGFWMWRRHADTILMCAQREIAALDLNGRKRWTAAVTPPWRYSVAGDKIRVSEPGREFTIGVARGEIQR